MILNQLSLLNAAPIKDMIGTKEKNNGVSNGLGEAGYDIRLKQDIMFEPGPDGKEPIIMINDKRVRGRFVIASAIEEFQMPDNLVAIVHDKSTWARKSISVFNTVIEPGWRGFLTLEIVFHGFEAVFIPAGSGIAQVIFHMVTDPIEYKGKYQDQPDNPVSAILEKDTTEDGFFTSNYPPEDR